MALLVTRGHFWRAWPLLVVALVGAWSIVTVSPVAGAPFLKSESFGTDPLWDGFNNVVFDEDFDPPLQIQDFKWSDTNFAGGTSQGEAGGKMTRDPLAYFADNVGALDPSTTSLEMSGTAVFACTADPFGGPTCDPLPAGNALVGWFNRYTDFSENKGRNPPDFIGFYTDETTEIRLTAGPNRVTPQNSAGQILDSERAMEVDQPFTYDIQYNHLTGEITGVFNVSVDFGGDGTYEFDEFTGTISLSASERDAFSDFNRHGMFVRNESFNDTQIDFYIDDIDYTADDPIPDPTDYVWTTNGAGDWNRASNWNQVHYVPKENTQTAILGDASGSASTVYMDSPVTVKGIRFDNQHRYGISGSGSVNLEADAGSAAIDVLQGSHEFQLPVNLVSDAQVMTEAGAAVAFDNALNLGERTLTKVGDGTMLVNNLQFAGGGSILVQQGALGGVGAVGGDISNSSVVAPGESTGKLIVAGDFNQDSAGTLAIEIAANEFDLVEVLGAATLDGILDVTLLGGFTPAIDQSFTVLTATLGGITDQGLALAATDEASFDLNVQSTLVELIYTGSSASADQDNDGDVDGADFLLIQQNDPSLITLWASQYGNGVNPLAEAAAVPEPASLVLVGLAVATALSGVRRVFPMGGSIMRLDVGRRIMLLALGVGLAGFVAADTAQAQTFTKIETFDDGAGNPVDPQWVAVNNDDQLFVHQFGFQVATFGQPSNFAEGENPGEIGGFFTSKNFTTPSYYADDIGTLDPAVDALAATGKAVAREDDGFMMLGWFDKDSDLFPSVDQSGNSNELNFLGFLMDDDRFFLRAGGNEAQVGDSLGINTPTSFAISYDPNANAGGGALLGTVGGKSNTVFLPPGFKDSLEDFDRYGLLAYEDQEIDPARQAQWFFDDMTYSTSIPQPAITEIEWASDTSGNAGFATFWSPPKSPDQNDITVTLGQRITKPRTVFADTSLIMKKLLFDNEDRYTVAGQGILTLEADAGDAAIEVLEGSHEFQINVILGSDTDVTVPSGQTLTFNNGLDLNGFTLTNLGPGDLIVNNRLDLNGGQFSDLSGTLFINVAVPEPSTLVLLAVGLASVAWPRRTHP